MTKPLAGRHALVTGGGRGIGAAIARHLLSLGASVTLTGRDAARLKAAAAEMGGHAFGIAMDVTDPAAIEAGFAKAAEQFGPIAILVNNAGIAKAAPFGKTDLAMWDDILRTDLTGPINQSGAVNGVQIDVALSYKLKDWLTVGAGARYWQFNANGTSTFQTIYGPSQQVTRFTTERYGPFVQVSVAM